MRTALGGSRGRIVTQIVAKALSSASPVGHWAWPLPGAALWPCEPWRTSRSSVSLRSTFESSDSPPHWLCGAARLLNSPTLRMLRADPATALNDATMRSIGSRSTARGQSALVVLQVALGVTLLAVAALIVKSMQTMTRIDAGYAVSGLLSTHIEIPTWKIADDREAFRIRQALVQRATDISWCGRRHDCDRASRATAAGNGDVCNSKPGQRGSRRSSERRHHRCEPRLLRGDGHPNRSGTGICGRRCGESGAGRGCLACDGATVLGGRVAPWGTNLPRPLLCAALGTYVVGSRLTSPTQVSARLPGHSCTCWTHTVRREAST